MITLRDYQRDAVDAIYGWFETASGNPLIVVPTGGGKSAIIAAFVREVVETWKDQRILIVTHVKELIDQNHRMLLRAWPEAPAGIYSAGLGRRDHRAQILFAGVQSICKRTAEIGAFDLILVDEAHLIPRSGMGQYQTLLAGMKLLNPDVKLIGLTATPFRLGEGALHAGQGPALFHGIAYDCDMLRLIDEGWLAPVTNQAATDVGSKIDTTNVPTQAGEFIEGELETEAMSGDHVQRGVAELVRRGRGRRAWLIFACGIDHARAIASELRAYKIPTVEVYGAHGREERDGAVAAIRSGEARAAVNVKVLTTGFDAPHIDLIAMFRPTMSAGLYVQMVGRGMRPIEGKSDCLVLDFGGNVMRHGPVNAVVVREPGDGGGPAPIKECPLCGALVATGTLICKAVVGTNEQTNEPLLCGHAWPEPERETHNDVPDHVSKILQRGAKVEWRDVAFHHYNRHHKDGKPDSMRVDYVCGLGRGGWVSEWVCFEHEGFARRKAASWWIKHGGSLPVPANVEEAIVRARECRELKKPIAVYVDLRGEYPQLLQVKTERVTEQPKPTTLDELPF